MYTGCSSSASGWYVGVVSLWFCSLVLFACKERLGQSKIAHMVKRCRLQQPYMLWCIAFAMQTNFATVCPALKDMLERVFVGWVQTRINEKANKVLRDSQNRESSSKVCHGSRAHRSRYFRLLNCCVLSSLFCSAFSAILHLILQLLLCGVCEVEGGGLCWRTRSRRRGRRMSWSRASRRNRRSKSMGSIGNSWSRRAGGASKLTYLYRLSALSASGPDCRPITSSASSGAKTSQRLQLRARRTTQHS